MRKQGNKRGGLTTGPSWRNAVLLAVLGLLLSTLIFNAGCGEQGSSAAHINDSEEASTNDLLIDEREGSPPPPVETVNLDQAAERANCYLLLDVEEERKGGHDHLAPNEKPWRNSRGRLSYTDPPVNGDHVETPYQQADGAYLETPSDTAVLGALEHGRMAIQYAPDLSEDTQLQLKGVFDTMYGGTLLFPNDRMDFAVAATTWGNLLGCTGWEKRQTLDAIRAFGEETWGKYGDEPVDSVPFEGPTPTDPEKPDEVG